MADLLIDDDEPLVSLGPSRHFSRVGHAVREAGTGSEALAAFRARRPDVILLDVNLPDMSGLGLAGALEARAFRRRGRDGRCRWTFAYLPPAPTTSRHRLPPGDFAETCTTSFPSCRGASRRRVNVRAKTW